MCLRFRVWGFRVAGGRALVALAGDCVGRIGRSYTS